MAAVEAKCSDYSTADDGQSSRACSGFNGGENGFMLFGVRVITEGSFRKSASMSNLAQFDQQTQDSNTDVAAGYASDDVVHPSARSRVRRRVGVPWSEEEHKLFLLGLQKVGKGDWRGISRNYVKTRTPTQVASHAQKYFLRQNNNNRRHRRSSLFDITTETVAGSTREEQMYEENVAQPPISQHTPCKILEKVPMTTTFPVAIKPLAVQNPCDPMESLTLGQLNQMNNSPNPIRPIPILPVPPSSKMANLDLNKTKELDLPSLSLNISSSQAQAQAQAQPPPQPQLQSNQETQPSNQQAAASPHVSAFQGMPANFNGSGGDSIISVA